MQYDVAIIGSGPGGYVCAIRCAQLGMKTALIEKYETLGGTCLNVGCVPSKAMLDSAEHFHRAKTQFDKHGIELDNLRVNLKKLVQRKNDVVADTCKGLLLLMKKNKIDVHYGQGYFKGKNTIGVKPKTGDEKTVAARHIVIATGSKPITLPTMPIDKQRVITSTEALQLETVPKHLIIIGGGAIGLELGSVYSRLGSKVSVVELLDTIIPMSDLALGKELQRSLGKLGFQFYLGHKVIGVANQGDTVLVKAQSQAGDPVELSGDYCLVSVGRRPYTDGLELEKVGVKLNPKGRVVVNDRLETTTPGIFAIGDVIEGPMLAHKASEEGVFVAEIMAGQQPQRLNPLLIPNVVYTWPEVAGVGYTEEQLKQKNIAYKSGMFPYKASGRARASMDVEGFAKILADQKTDEVLGVHIIGGRAADVIMEAVVAMEFKASAEDLARICHPHPTMSEALHEAALAATQNRPLHI